MIYVRCLDEQGVSLRAGSIYRVLPPEVNDSNLLRIADETSGEAGSEGGYLFSAESFETVQPVLLLSIYHLCFMVFSGQKPWRPLHRFSGCPISLYPCRRVSLWCPIETLEQEISKCQQTLKERHTVPLQKPSEFPKSPEFLLLPITDNKPLPPILTRPRITKCPRIADGDSHRLPNRRGKGFVVP